jgi:hypothetical protein
VSKIASCVAVGCPGPQAESTSFRQSAGVYSDARFPGILFSLARPSSEGVSEGEPFDICDELNLGAMSCANRSADSTAGSKTPAEATRCILFMDALPRKARLAGLPKENLLATQPRGSSGWALTTKVLDQGPERRLDGREAIM